MKQEYRVSRLTSDRIVQAYPLVRDVMGHPSLEQWVDYAGSLVGEDSLQKCSGIMVAERDNYIRGMFSFQLVPSLSHERVLFLQDFAVLEMAGRERIVEALIGASQDIAQKYCCQIVRAQVPQNAQWALDHLTQMGHEVENVGLCFRLTKWPRTASVHQND